MPKTSRFRRPSDSCQIDHANSTMSATSFNAIVMDSVGRIAMHRVEAADLAQARLLAGPLGQTVLQCEAVETHLAARGGRAGRGLFTNASEIDTVSFSQDMATLMDAGVTVKEALHALARRERVPFRRQILDQLNTGVSEGLSLSTALERSQAFPDLLVATVAASEQTGDLAVGLSRFARHQQSLRTVRDRVVGACVYPLLLLTVGALVVSRSALPRRRMPDQ